MSEGRWSDLTARVGSAVVLAGLAGIELWLGGLWFESFIAIVTGLMVWELMRMIAPERSGPAIQMALLTGFAVLLAYHLPPLYSLPVLVAPALVGAGQAGRYKGLYAVFALWIAFAGLGFIWIREVKGLDWMLWLILVVVATDMAGYFVGKLIGGPKFWPRVSPKKTWSGTAGGWVAAALVGGGFAFFAGLGAGLLILSVLASMASQAGDFAESALKRRMGVKDSSNLIPGHGGFLDRFDGMMGAAVFVLLVGLLRALWGA
ncbi:phosphatidate cytidylyltransferase [Ruegeria sp. PrR005]|uniref:Phosphatidate cytidylyltransferase n=1 Tax=Ruegeria sp. PrR005 TaxID=2706882 RepID=A0A6B2NH49_9RHOB|nr:phosphatidate cytidylyltransferase [Ruegeria sp. PrR005]NDW43501.1 phosphatidate cytidylyltransferase [Ruegeria sp. PrR005]